jgi:hypothetical protein
MLSARLNKVSAERHPKRFKKGILPTLVQQAINVGRIRATKKAGLFLVRLSIASHYDESDAEKPALNIFAEYAVMFSSPDCPDEQCIAALWPHWRDLVRATTMRMGYPPMNLPLDVTGTIEIAV